MSSLKTFSYLLLVVLIKQSAFSQTIPSFNMAFGLSDNSFNTIYDITTDDNGNVFATGTCGSSMDMDPSSATVLAGASGFFVSKYSPSGAYMWHKIFTSPSGSTGFGTIQGIRINHDGDVIIAGDFNGVIDFDPNAGVNSLFSTVFYPGLEPSCNPAFQDCCLPEDPGCLGVYSYDMFLASLNNNGVFKWAKTYGGVGDDGIEKIDIDSNNDIIVAGNFQDQIDIEGNTLFAFNNNQTLVLKLDKNGVLDFTIDLPTGNRALAVACDDLGNFYLSTNFSSTVDFDPGLGITQKTSMGSGDIAIVKFNSLGNFLWVKTFEGFQSKDLYDLVVDFEGNVIGIGGFRATVDFDPNVGTNFQNSVGLLDAFIVKLSSSGNLVWVKTLQGVNNCLGIALATNTIGDIFATGYFKFTVDFNPGAPNFPISSNGDDDIFQVGLSKDGIFKWATSYGGVDEDYGTAMAIDPFDRIITAGFYANASVDFDPSPSGASILPTAGGFSIFVQSLGTPNYNCPQSLTLNNITGTGNYNASENITGNGTVSSGTINYQAGNYILLDQGFYTGSNTVFKASIGGCP